MKFNYREEEIAFIQHFFTMTVKKCFFKGFIKKMFLEVKKVQINLVYIINLFIFATDLQIIC